MGGIVTRTGPGCDPGPVTREGVHIMADDAVSKTAAGTLTGPGSEPTPSAHAPMVELEYTPVLKTGAWLACGFESHWGHDLLSATPPSPWSSEPERLDELPPAVLPATSGVLGSVHPADHGRPRRDPSLVAPHPRLPRLRQHVRASSGRAASRSACSSSPPRRLVVSTGGNRCLDDNPCA